MFIISSVYSLVRKRVQLILDLVSMASAHQFTNAILSSITVTESGFIYSYTALPMTVWFKSATLHWMHLQTWLNNGSINHRITPAPYLIKKRPLWLVYQIQCGYLFELKGGQTFLNEHKKRELTGVSKITRQRYSMQSTLATSLHTWSDCIMVAYLVQTKIHGVDRYYKNVTVV